MGLARTLGRLSFFRVMLFSFGLGLMSLSAQVGALDATFAPAVDGSVRAMATQSDGKILVVGDFTAIDGHACRGVARYNKDGTYDTSFASGKAGANGIVHSVTLQTDGKILICGDFTTVHGTTRNRVARLNSDGSLDTTFDPGTGPNSSVYAVLPNWNRSGVIIAGDFTTVNGVSRGRLAALNPNGALDTYTFTGAGANGTVYAISTTASLSGPSGYYIAGAFTTVNNIAHPYVAQLDSYSGAPIGSFNSNAAGGPDGPVYTLKLDNSGFLWIGGDFNTVGGVSHPKLAILNATTGVAREDFSFSIDGAVRSLLIGSSHSGSGLTSTTSILVGGDFGNVNGTSRSRMAQITMTSSIYMYTYSWSLDAVYAPQVNGPVYSLVSESDGKTFVGGAFTSVGAVTQKNLARLYGEAGMAVPSTPVKPTPGPGSNTKLAVLWSGVSYTTGYRLERSPDGVTNWSTLSPTLTQSPYIDSGLNPGTTYYYRVTSYSTNGEGSPSVVGSGTTLPEPWTKAGVLDTAFATTIGTGPSSSVNCQALQPDGKILVGGGMSSFNGMTVKNIVRLLPDGTVDASFNSSNGPDGGVQSIAVQPDGKILIGGDFTKVGGITRNRMARLNANGSLDTTFAPISGADSAVESIALQPDGKILIAGRFTTVDGATHAGIARLHVDGTVDSSFNAQLSFSLGYDVDVQSDGKILVSGFFQTANGVKSGNIARFNPDGSLDTSFASGSGADGWIESQSILPDGKVLIVGAFGRYNTVARSGVARLNADGSLDGGFDPGPGVQNGWPSSAQVQNDGKVILGGFFTKVRDAVQIRVTRLNADGSLDSSFQSGIGANGTVNSVLIQQDGKCLVAGYFSEMDGVPAKYIARLLADNGTAAPAATPTAIVSPTSSTSVQITWSEAAYSSGYQIYQSADGVSNWTLADTVTSGITSWTISGLPVGTTRYFRVRAYNTNGQAPDSLVSSAKTYTPYQQWKVDHMLAPDASDTGSLQGKGVPHLLDYAFGGNPTTSDALSTQPIVAIPENHLQVTFWCDTARSDLIYTVQSSPDLIDWTDIAQSNGGASTASLSGLSSVTDSTTGRRQVTVTDLGDPGSGTARYLRVKITEAP